MRGDRAAISYADGHTGGGKGIPRALMRNTTITRPPRSIATAFPSATRGRCVHERDRRFESVSLQRTVSVSHRPPSDLELFHRTDSLGEAYEIITKGLTKNAFRSPGPAL